MSTGKLRFHFIPNTHLDREWSLNFQHTRQLTVGFLDQLIEIMESVPEYTFLLDSQAVPIEDYLAIRPEHESKIRSLIQERRLFAGPWYNALEMNLLGGESIVRNLLYGHTMIERFGPVTKVGYTPFGWGQISQLPQIYKGFGIDSVIFYRGITTEQIPHSEFVWKGADGTEMLGSRLGTPPRMNFYLEVWRPAFFNHLPDRIARRLRWFQDDGTPFRLCDGDHRYDHGAFLSHDKELNLASLEDNLRKLINGEQQVFGTGEIAFMHGFDTSTPDMREKEVIEACQKYLQDNEELFFSSLPDYMQAVADAVEMDSLPRIEGEARHLATDRYGYAFIGNDILSIRTRQKAHTAEAERRLTRLAEPFAAMRCLAGGTEWPEQLFDMAWLQFMKCHPHDTLGGCGLDQIERDAMGRLDDAISLSDYIQKESLIALQSQIDTSAADASEIILNVFNSAPHAREELVTAFIDIPDEFEGGRFHLRDMEGALLPFSSEPTGITGRVYRDKKDIALGVHGHEERIVFPAKLPGMGYRAYRLCPGEADGVPSAVELPENVLENAYLRAEIQSNGTLRLLDKASGETFENLGAFEDTGESGHAWTHVEPKDAVPLTTHECHALVECLEQTPLRTRYRVIVALDIPIQTEHVNEGDWRDSKRSEVTRRMEIETEYQLDAGERAVDLTVRFRNDCRDHRLRLLFPSCVATDYVKADMAFDVLRRRIDRSEENPCANLPHLTFPFQRFVSLSDGERHLAFIGKGLKEYEVSTDEDRTIAVTLMRAFRNGICTFSAEVLDRQDDRLAQAEGAHSFQCRITTTNPEVGCAEIFAQSEHFDAPLTVCQTRPRPGSLPSTASFLELDNPSIIFSSLKKAARSNDLILRLYNPSESSQSATLRFLNAPDAAFFANLNEETLEQISAIDGKGQLPLQWAPKEILTLSLRYDSLG
jgi:alpha-mannosidase